MSASGYRTTGWYVLSLGAGLLCGSIGYRDPMAGAGCFLVYIGASLMIHYPSNAAEDSDG